jgi:vacuolar protein-sorting-associated protein 4
MSYVDFVTPAIQHAKEAAALDEKKEYDKAYNMYVKSIDYFMTAIKHEPVNSKKKQMLKEKVHELLERAEVLKKFLNEQKDQHNGDGEDGKGGAAAKTKSKAKSKEQGEEAELTGMLESAVLTEKPNVKWEDVAGLEGAKEALKEAVILPMKFPQLFTGKRTPWAGILLYGPPGTGKSYLAKAVATEANSTFISISSSDVVSKWQGESEKLVRQLFKIAREKKPSIIFIDEIDSLVSARSDNDNESSRRIKTEFLVQMQGVGKDAGGILVLGATNIPWGLDSAIRRRFERRIYIPLPDLPARRAMFSIHIGKTPHNVQPHQFEELARLTEGYSGSDIETLVKNALLEPVRTCQMATHFKKVRAPSIDNPEVMCDDMLTPCSPGTPGAIEMSLNEVESKKLLPPVVTYNDFLKALKTSRPSVSQSDLVRYTKFTEEFGQES